MPPATARSNPLEPDLGSESFGSINNFAAYVPPFLTLGLHKMWLPAYEWAAQSRVLYEFLLLLDVCRNHDNSAVFGTLLAELCETRSFERLTAWSETEPGATVLLRLALASRLKPEMLTAYSIVTKAKPASQQNLGKLGHHYLIALIVEWVGGIPAEHRHWIQTLRIWTIVHAVKRAQRGRIEDSNLRVLSDGLRLACANDLLRRQDLVSLESDAADFETLNRHLVDRARYLKTRITGDKLQARRYLLKAIAEIAAGHDSVDEGSGSTSVLLSGRLARNQNVSAEEGAVLKTRYQPDEDDGPAGDALVSEDGLDVVVEVAPTDSYAHQRLSAGTVLLLGIEDYQYLPWSWFKPNPYEIQSLQRWIQSLRASPFEVERVLGTFTWMADTTGRSLRRVLDFPLTRSPEDEWGGDLIQQRLHRLPPRRIPGWLPDTDEARRWVRPVAEMIEIGIPDDIAVTLRALAAKTGSARVLGDLWLWPDDPIMAWRSALPDEIQRVTQGMLGQLLPQRLLERYGDGGLARVLSSHPKSAMPGACAYASWTRSVTESTVNLEELPDDAPDPGSPICAGSRLDPIDALFIESLDAAFKRLETLRATGNPIAFHNAYTAYCVVLLLAATGGRPITDPLESPSHFDLEIGFAYIDDKGVDDAHGGRLVPLPTSLTKFLREEYPRHLRQLALYLESGHPSLAESIRSLTQQCSTVRMPYFFLLSEAEPLEWVSVSETAIDMLGLFSWPLPLRLFRHRLAIRLRWLATDAELIDAILGHAEAGSATHGDDSFRVWLDDAARIRPQLEAVFARLQPKLPATWFSPLQARQKSVKSSERERTTSVKFGIARRTHQRNQTRVNAEAQARQEIDTYLAGRPLEKIAEEDIAELVKQLILNEKGLPRTTARLRYAVLEDMLDSLWREQGKRVRIKKRFAPFRPTASPFRPSACGAIDLHRQLTAHVLNMIAERPISRLSQVELGVLAVVQLCIERRVADARLLTDLVHCSNVRLVILNGKAYLEHGDSPTRSDPDACVRRIRLDNRLYRMLAVHLRVGSKREIWDKPIHRTLATTAAYLNYAGRLSSTEPNLSELVQALCELTDQVNVISLPGVLAGYLAGRVESYALCWRDWSRIELGEILDFSGMTQPEDDDAWEEVRGGVPLGRAGNADGESSQDQAAEFMQALRTLLECDADNVSASNSRDKRRQLAANLGKCIAQYNTSVSTTQLLLGQWLAAIVYRPGKRGKYIAGSTLLRYLGALGPRFVGYGYNLDLLAADEEDVTTFYAAMLDHGDVSDSEMVAGRLGDFHRWARTHGVCDPDWNEMPMVTQGRRASPGFITEEEYQAALKLLLSEKDVPYEERLWRAALLIYCYRFGLRETEALGLTREDIQFHEGSVCVVLVRDNHLRKLKTRASRRQVPLLFRLSKTEQTVLRDTSSALEADTGDVRRHGILERVIRDPGLRLRTVRAVIATLKRVTGNQTIVLHHARHTAAMRVAMEFIDLDQFSVANAVLLEKKKVTNGNIPLCMLGTKGSTRRTGWALSRYTGHAGSGTLLKSYFHLFDMWHEKAIPIAEQGQTNVAAGDTVVLDNLPRLASVDASLLEELPVLEGPPRVEQMIRCMRLISRRTTIERAASATGLKFDYAEMCFNELMLLSARLQLSSTVKRGGKDREEDLAFLRRITEGGWERLLSLARRMDKALSITIGPKPLENRSPLALEEVKQLIGPTRQLIMWKESHFATVRAFINDLELDRERYLIGISTQCEANGRIIALASTHGFLSDRYSLSDSRQVAQQKQLDSTTDLENDNRVEKRCCLLLSEVGAGNMPRNRFELVALFFAYAALGGGGSESKSGVPD